MLLLTITAWAATLLSPGRTQGESVSREEIGVWESDGAFLHVRIRSDERAGVAETLDGYTLVHDPQTHFLCYARQSAGGGKLVSTGVRPAQTNAATLGLTPHLRMPREATSRAEAGPAERVAPPWTAEGVLAARAHLQAREDRPEWFQGMVIRDRILYHRDRYIGHALVEMDAITYHFAAADGAFVEKRVRWRDDLPDELPAVISEADAGKLAAGDVRFCRLYYIAPDSSVFPLDFTPQHPCWVVWADRNGRPTVLIVDAVTSEFLGHGVSPPVTTAFTLGGPNWGSCDTYYYPYAANAKWWFDYMGYETVAADNPPDNTVRQHIQSDTVALFYELAHGDHTSFHNICPDSESITHNEIEAWIAEYHPMRFSFLGSCGGMCGTGNETLAYELTKGTTEGTVVVGYCGMGDALCATDCWPVAMDWQNELFYYMKLGYTIREAFDRANIAYPDCIDDGFACMRFHGDETLRAVMDGLPSLLRFPDCNGNGINDVQDIAQGTSQDCNGNGIPDECEEDCNGNGIPDDCDLSSGVSFDCNGNLVPDECDIAEGTSDDCNGNGIPDECDIAAGTSDDCNGNDVPDECDIAQGPSSDCDGNLVPDDCQPDCNDSGTADVCEILAGLVTDANGNGVPDECEIAPKFEAGFTTANHVTKTVTLQNTYTNPVVVCTGQYFYNGKRMIPRVSNVTANSFDLRLVDPTNASQTYSIQEVICYWVMEQGVSELNGVKMEAWKYTSTVTDGNGDWTGEARRYGRQYDNPVVLGQVMSANDAWSVFWTRGSRKTSVPSPTALRTGKHTGNSGLDRADETIGVIVFESVTGTGLGGVPFEAAVGPATVQGLLHGTPPHTAYALQTPMAAPQFVAVASPAGMQGNTGSWAQRHGQAGSGGSTYLLLSLDDDLDRTHPTGERVAYALLKSALVWPRVPDFDADGDVDLKDFGVFQACYGQAAAGICLNADLTGDGLIDAADVPLFVNQVQGP